MGDKNTVFQQKLTLNIRGTILDLSTPRIMGIVNLTPDSFYDGGVNNARDSALRKCGELVSEGADILDLGAYSSRPGADHISLETELERLLPVLKAIRSSFPDIPISIDTFRAEVARIAVSEGADIVNDISGGEMDRDMFSTIAELQVPYILMHMKGNPQTMASEAKYNDVTLEVNEYFAVKIAQLKALGINDIILDPGFGFAKTPAHSFALLKDLQLLKMHGHPVLAGLSRKSMIYWTLGIDAEDALNGTTAANTIALMNGANILRVHDARAAAEAIRITSMVM